MKRPWSVFILAPLFSQIKELKSVEGNDLSKSRKAIGEKTWRVFVEKNTSTGWMVGLNYFMFHSFLRILWICFLIISIVIILLYPQGSLGWGDSKGTMENRSFKNILHSNLLWKIFLEERGLGITIWFRCNAVHDCITVRSNCHM